MTKTKSTKRTTITNSRTPKKPASTAKAKKRVPPKDLIDVRILTKEEMEANGAIENWVPDMDYLFGKVMIVDPSQFEVGTNNFYISDKNYNKNKITWIIFSDMYIREDEPGFELEQTKQEAVPSFTFSSTSNSPSIVFEGLEGYVIDLENSTIGKLVFKKIENTENTENSETVEPEKEALLKSWDEFTEIKGFFCR
jgi:hypothetical protein